jgi:hypothetical protein
MIVVSRNQGSCGRGPGIAREPDWENWDVTVGRGKPVAEGGHVESCDTSRREGIASNDSRSMAMMGIGRSWTRGRRQWLRRFPCGDSPQAQTYALPRLRREPNLGRPSGDGGFPSHSRDSVYM